MVDAYCVVINGEMWVKGMSISPYFYGSFSNHEMTRDRKLLLNRKELNKLQKKVAEKGLTIVPVSLFLNEAGIAKMEIALARGKKLHDKREDIKDRDTKRDLDRTKKMK